VNLRIASFSEEKHWIQATIVSVTLLASLAFFILSHPTGNAWERINNLANSSNAPSTSVSDQTTEGEPPSDDHSLGLKPDSNNEPPADSQSPTIPWDSERLELWSLRPLDAAVTEKAIQDAYKKQSQPQASNPIDLLLPSSIPSQSTPIAKHHLLQRLSLDLVGLRATQEEVELFQRDNSPQAYERQVDRLLQDPRFGEHWARMWLDVVRYSDSNGFDWDEFRREAWRYRDFVVHAFNDDLSFDTFLLWQLAGDELAGEAIARGNPRTPEEQSQLLATGYLRMGPYDNAAKLFNEQDRARVEVLTDLTETTGAAFLGLTLSCCRCHDHKTDPLTQEDHYRFRAFFAAANFLDDTSIEITATDVSGEDRITSDEKETDREQKSSNKKEERKADRTATKGFFMSDRIDGIDTIHVLKQGDHRAPLQVVEPGFPSVLSESLPDLAPPSHGKTTGRRLALARWMTNPTNPWTARVYVNRIWQQLFGMGIVATPNDFGVTGSKPTSITLLDHLAMELIEHKWSTKWLVRSIVMSDAYRNQHLAEQISNPRRLSAEQMRDVLLQVTGQLHNRLGGPPVWPEVEPEVLQANPAVLDDNETKTKGWYPSAASEQTVRSLYLVQKRTIRIPWMETFDLPENTVSCGRREGSIVPSQALAVLNSEWVARGAQQIADRISQTAIEAGSDSTSDQSAILVRELYCQILSRQPNVQEIAWCTEYLKDRSLAELALVLLNTNELAFIP